MITGADSIPGVRSTSLTGSLNVTTGPVTSPLGSAGTPRASSAAVTSRRCLSPLLGSVTVGPDPVMAASTASMGASGWAPVSVATEPETNAAENDVPAHAEPPTVMTAPG